MNRLKIIGLASLLGFSFLGEKYPKLINELDKPIIIEEQTDTALVQKSRRAILSKRIIYKEFSKIDFDEFKGKSLDDWYVERIGRLNRDILRVNDRKKLERFVFEEAENLGYSKERIKKIRGKEAINLCIDIVNKRIDYFDVDNDKNLRNLSIEDYLEIGKGDCDKYSGAFIAVFDIIKEYNKNLENIYASYERFGGFDIEHSWNSIIIPLEKEIILTHIDLTFYDGGGSIEAKKGYHIPKDYLEIYAIFFRGVGLFDESYASYERLIEKVTDTEKRGVGQN